MDTKRSKDRVRMTTVYDEDGTAHEVSNLNAHDLVNHAGYTRHNPVRPAKATDKAEAAPKAQAGDAGSQKVDVATPAPDDAFTEMSKDDMVTYAKEKFNVQLDGRKSRAATAAEVRKLVATLAPTPAVEPKAEAPAAVA